MAGDTAPTLDQDPFLKSIREFRTLFSANGGSLTPSKQQQQSPTTSSDDRVDDLQHQNKKLNLKLQDALKDAVRERDLRASLEKAFDQLSDNRNLLKQHLEEAVATGGAHKESAVSVETRILSIEAEKIEALRACEEANKKAASKEKLLADAQRLIEELQEQVKTQEQSFSQFTEEQTSKIQTLETSKTALETKWKASETKLSTVQAQLAVADEKVLKLKTTASRQEKEISALNVKHIREIESLENEKVALETALRDEEKTREELDEKLVRQAEENTRNDESWRSQLETFRYDLEENQTNLADTRGEINQTRQMVEQVQSLLEARAQDQQEKDELKRKLAEKEELVEEQGKRIAEMEKIRAAIDHMVHTNETSNTDSQSNVEPESDDELATAPSVAEQGAEAESKRGREEESELELEEETVGGGSPKADPKDDTSCKAAKPKRRRGNEEHTVDV